MKKYSYNKTYNMFIQIMLLKKYLTWFMLLSLWVNITVIHANGKKLKSSLTWFTNEFKNIFFFFMDTTWYTPANTKSRFHVFWPRFCVLFTYSLPQHWSSVCYVMSINYPYYTLILVTFSILSRNLICWLLKLKLILFHCINPFRFLFVYVL